MANVFPRKKKRKWLVGGVALVLVILSVSAFWVWRRQTPRPEPFDYPFPGAAFAVAAELSRDEGEATLLRERSQSLLMDEDQLWQSWYQLSGRLGRPPAQTSMTHRFEDQLLHGQHLLEREDQEAFERWWRSLRLNFLLRDDALQGPTADASDLVVRDWFFMLRLLGQSLTLYPDSARQQDFEALEDGLWRRLEGALPTSETVAVPTPPPHLDPDVTPTPPPATPLPEPPPPSRVATRLEELDLFMLQQLGRSDPKWQPLYEQAVQVAEGGFLGPDLPLYALAYDPQSDSYIAFEGSLPAVRLEPALKTMLQLAKIDRLSPRSLAWLSDQLLNRGGLHPSYHVVQGNPMSQEEAPFLYAIVARIARIEGDAILYEQAVDKMLWHQATLEDSEALSALFREDPAEGTFRVHAQDNLWALLALQ